MGMNLTYKRRQMTQKLKSLQHRPSLRILIFQVCTLHSVKEPIMQAPIPLTTNYGLPTMVDMAVITNAF